MVKASEVETSCFTRWGFFAVKYNTPELRENKVSAGMTVAVLSTSANKPYSDGPRNRAVTGLRKKPKAKTRKFAART